MYILSPILTVEFYGKKDYEKIYSKISAGAPIASVILIPVYGFIYDSIKNYLPVIIEIIILLIISLGCISLGWRKRCTIKGCPEWKD